jgi:hypothetical protein
MQDGPRERWRFRLVLDYLRRLMGKRQPPLGRKQPPLPDDPYSYRMAPVRRGPRGRSGAAVAEPEDDSYRAFPPRQ